MCHPSTNFYRTDKTFGELEADMTVIVDRDEYESSGTDMNVKDVLEAVANKGKVGNLQVEPASLVVREPGRHLSSSRESWISLKKVFLLSPLKSSPSQVRMRTTSTEAGSGRVRSCTSLLPASRPSSSSRLSRPRALYARCAARLQRIR